MTAAALRSGTWHLLVLLGLALLLTACSSSPSRERSELMQLARQADQNYQNGKFDAARRQYEKVVSANPKFVPGHVRLGVIAYREGDAVAARQRFELAAQLDPRNEQVKYNLAMLHLNEATRLLNDYATTAQAGRRDDVLVLLSRLREFGGK